MATLKYLSQYFSTTLNVGGGIDDSQTTGIILLDVSGVDDITKPGQICITYSDPIDTSVAEWIDYTSINGSNELVGAVRGREGYSAHAHLQSATVAFVLSASHHNDIVDQLNGTESGTTLTSPVINTGITGTAVLDEDNMASDSATKLATQQSIKAYVDANQGIISTTKYAPQGFLLNGKIVPSVASSDLTVAIKGMDGNDPSASNPVYVRIGDTVRTITAALSVTKNDATNWFNAGSAELATKEIDYFVYLGYNATDGTVIGFSRIPYATLYSHFSATSTNEKYCAISTITNAAAGDNYENVGRFAATLSAGAGYTWTVPTFTTTNLIQRPIYETRYLSYAITYAGWSANPGVTSNYKLLNDLCFLQYEHTGSTGTSNATTATYTLPMTAANIAGTRHVSLGRNYNNSAEGTGGQCVISGAASTAALYNGVSGAAWTASGGKFWEGTIHYRIS